MLRRYSSLSTEMPWSILLLEGHDDQDGSVRLNLGYEESDDYEETLAEYALYRASMFKAHCRASELRVLHCLDSATHCWLVKALKTGSNDYHPHILSTLCVDGLQLIQWKTVFNYG